jgi:diaminopimelate epimerase
MSRFSKYSGAGNDFLILRAEEVGLDDVGQLARRMCARSTGVGVDGLILVRSLSPAAVRVRFFNPDGSEFGTCGNGSRCAVRYAADRGLVEEDEFTLVTDDGEVGAALLERAVALYYRLDARVDRSLKVSLGNERRKGWLIQIGTPHFVIPLDTLPEGEIESLCRSVRHEPELGPAGANVDLVSLAGTDSAVIRTFERGVEAETRACGSGAMAALLALRKAGLAGRSLSLETRSGAVLTVELLDDEEGRVIRLSGPADHIFDGVFPDRTG